MDKNAYLMCEELALAAFDCIGAPATADKIELRKSAVACLFATKCTPRPALAESARTLAFTVLRWIDTGTPDAYRALNRASGAYERLRIA